MQIYVAGCFERNLICQCLDSFFVFQVERCSISLFSYGRTCSLFLSKCSLMISVPRAGQCNVRPSCNCKFMGSRYFFSIPLFGAESLAILPVPIPKSHGIAHQREATAQTPVRILTVNEAIHEAIDAQDTKQGIGEGTNSTCFLPSWRFASTRCFLKRGFRRRRKFLRKKPGFRTGTVPACHRRPQPSNSRRKKPPTTKKKFRSRTG